MEPESRRSKSKYQRQKIRVQKRRRNRRMGQKLAIAVALVFAVLVACGAGIWLVVHYAKPQTDEQAAGLPAEPPEPRLIGMWLSDADSTISDLRTLKLLSADEELDMRRRLYKTVVTFTADTITTNTKGHVDAQPYEVVSKDGDAVVLKIHILKGDDKSKLPPTLEEAEIRLRFDGNNTYWLEIKPLPRECFRRIKEAP